MTPGICTASILKQFIIRGPRVGCAAFQAKGTVYRTFWQVHGKPCNLCELDCSLGFWEARSSRSAQKTPIEI